MESVRSRKKQAKMRAAIEKAKKEVGKLGEMSGDLEQAIDELGYAIEDKQMELPRLEDKAAKMKSKLTRLLKDYEAAKAKEDRRRGRLSKDKKLEPELLKARKVAQAAMKQFEAVFLKFKQAQAALNGKLPGMMAHHSKLEKKIFARNERIIKLQKELAKKFEYTMKVSRELKEHANAKTAIIKRNPALEAKIAIGKSKKGSVNKAKKEKKL